MVKLSEKILFDVNVDMIEGDVEIFNYCLDTATETDVPENFHHMLYAVLANAKATEPDEIVPVNKGTRRPGNRAERRKATIKVKRHLKEIEPLTMSVRRTRNGGVIKRGDTYSWLPEWKAMDKRNRRHNGKEICRDFVPDEIDTVSNPWAYTEEEKFELGYNCYNYLHGDFNHAVTEMIYKDHHNPGYLDDEDFGFDSYQSALDDREAAWDTIADLRREIETYKDFLNAFNLNTLFHHWKDNY